MTLSGLLASCARQDRDIQKVQLSVMCHTHIHAVRALYLSHTENEIEKIGGVGGALKSTV